jgi:hypothetical protein
LSAPRPLARKAQLLEARDDHVFDHRVEDLSRVAPIDGTERRELGAERLGQRGRQGHGVQHLLLDRAEREREVAAEARALVVGQLREPLAEERPAELRVEDLVGRELLDDAVDARLGGELALLGQERGADRLAQTRGEDHVAERALARRAARVLGQGLGREIAFDLGRSAEVAHELEAERRVVDLVHRGAQDDGLVLDARLGLDELRQEAREDAGALVLVERPRAPALARDLDGAWRVLALEPRAFGDLGCGLATLERLVEETLVLAAERRGADVEAEDSHPESSFERGVDQEGVEGGTNGPGTPTKHSAKPPS